MLIHLLSLIIFLLNISAENTQTIIIYIVKIIISLIEIDTPFKVSLAIFKLLEKGKILQIKPNTLPTISVEKYIPLVNATNCTHILPIPAEDFSVDMHPINTPREMNSNDTGINTIIDIIILILNDNPSTMAKE